MNNPRKLTTMPRWLVLAIGVAAMMSGTGAMAGQHEAASTDQREEVQQRADAAEDPEALAERAKESAEAKPQESWVSGMPARGQEWEAEDTEKIDEAAAERAARQRAARQEEGTATDNETVPDETIDQIIEKRSDGPAGSGSAEAEDDDEDTDGPPDGS